MLDVSGNGIGNVGATSLAKSAHGAPNLVSLYLSDCGIGGKDCNLLMELLFGPKSLLKDVNLSDNKLGNEGIQTLALWLPVCLNLEKLNLQSCGIGETGLIAIMQGCASNYVLEELLLGRNPVPKLTKGKALFDQVRSLLFRNISLLKVELPDITSSMEEVLSCARQQNATLKRCPDMGYFSERLWTSIPMPLFVRDALTKLDISGNSLVGLPFSILHLRALKWLNIADNLISVSGLPVHCRELQSLETLRVEGNPFLKYVPDRYNMRDLDDIFAFFDFFSETSLVGVEFKMVVLGAPRSGKTRFVKSLVTATPEELKKKPTLDPKMSRSTELLAVNEVVNQVSVSKVPLPLPDRAATLNVWDFAITDMEHHPMIQFYVSDGAFYSIVVNPSSSDWRESVVHWKGLIEGRVTRADVFLIVTHKDRNPQAATNVAAELQRDFVKPTRGKIGGIKVHGVWVVCSSNAKDLVPLLEKIAVVAHPRLNERGRIPMPWAFMESMLAEEEKVVSFPIVTYSRFEAMTLSCGALEQEVEGIAKYLHEIGCILHYSEIKKLQNVVIMSPLWLLKVVSRLLAFGTTRGSNGTFRAEDVAEIWPVFEFPERSHEPILQLLEAFEVLNPLGDFFVMPFLVPDEPPPEEDIPHHRVVMGAHYTRVYTFEGGKVPQTLMSQLIIRLLDVSTRAFSIWQSGVVFGLNERTSVHVVSVRLDHKDNLIKIDVWSNDRSGKILHIIHTTTESVLDGWYKNLTYQTFAKGPDGLVSLDELAKLSMQMRHKVNKVVSDDLAPDILMKSTCRVQWNEVEEGEFIAAGAFGSVTRGKYRNNDIVIKRMLTLEQMSQPEMYTSFLKECWAMSFLQHECIIKMIGISLEPLCMILEYMNSKDLRNFLDHHELPPWSLRLKILMDVARGMAYAHEQFPVIIHRDLKSPNVFLSMSSDGVLSAKVADLGLATVLPKLMKHAVVENPTWSAPEVIAREPYSHLADVYSFGIVMWEVLTGDFPFQNLWEKTQFTTEIVNRIIKGARPILPQDTSDVPAGYLDLMKSAWAHLEVDRPSFNQLSQALAVITRSYTNNLSSSSSSPSKGPFLKVMHRLPGMAGGLACAVNGTFMVTLRSKNGEFDVTDLRMDSFQSYQHCSPNFVLESASVAAAANGVVCCVDGVSSDLLVLDLSGKSQSYSCPEVKSLMSVVFVKDHIWTAGIEYDPNVSDAGPRTLLHVWQPDKFSRRLLAKVKGVLTSGISGSNFSVYFSCSRSGGTKNYLWRMRLSDKRCAKMLLPSPAHCLIDVQHRAEIWAVCPGSSCIVRASYDLKEQGRRNVGPNVFSTGVYLDHLRLVASIGSGSMCLWNCDSVEPFSIRPLGQDSANGMNSARHKKYGGMPHLIYFQQFGEVVAVTAAESILLLLETISPVPYTPESRKDKERKVSLVERREQATRTMLRKIEQQPVHKDRSNSDSSENNVSHRYNFSVQYTDKSRPMGLLNSLRMSSSDDLLGEESLKLSRVRRLAQSRERSASDSSDATSDDHPTLRSGRPRSSSSVGNSPRRGMGDSSVRKRSSSFHEGGSSQSTSLTTSPQRSPRRSNSDAKVRSPRVVAAAGGRSPRGPVGAPAPIPSSVAQPRSLLLQRNDSVVVERLALHGSNALNLFSYRRRSHGQKGSSPWNSDGGEKLGSSAEIPVEPVRVPDSPSLSKQSPVISRPVATAPSQPIPVAPLSRASTDSSSGSPATGTGMSSPKSLSVSDKMKRHSKDMRSSSSIGSGGGAVGLVGLVDDSTIEMLFQDSAPKMKRQSVRIMKRLQRAEEPVVLRRTSYSSVNIGGVSMKVNPAQTPPIVPKLAIPLNPSPNDGPKKKPSPKTSFWKMKKRSEDPSPAPSPPVGSTSPGSGGGGGSGGSGGTRQSPPMPQVIKSPVTNMISSGGRARSETVAYPAAKPKGHHRTRSVGQSADADDPEVQRVRELLTARLGNGIQAMKGRSGSVSGPTTSRGVSRGQEMLRRQLQGEMTPLSPPSSDERRFDLPSPTGLRSPKQSQSPIGSPKGQESLAQSSEPINLIDANMLESMYARRVKRDSAPEQRPPPPAEAPSPVSPSAIRMPSPSNSRPSRIPRALSRLSELFGKSKSEGNSASSSFSPSSAEIHTKKVDRRGSVAGINVSETLIRVSKQAEESRMTADKPVAASPPSSAHARRKSLGDSFGDRNWSDEEDSSQKKSPHDQPKKSPHNSGRKE